MKLKTVCIIAGLGLSSLALARGPGGHHGPPPLSEQLVEHQAELGVDDDTIDEVIEIEQRYRPQLEALHEAMRSEVEATLPSDVLDRLHQMEPEGPSGAHGRSR